MQELCVQRSYECSNCVQELSCVCKSCVGVELCVQEL